MSMIISGDPAPGWKKCGKPCPVCPFTLPDCAEGVSQNTGYRHTIVDPVICDTENCVYYWKCFKENCPDFPECENDKKNIQAENVRTS